MSPGEWLGGSSGSRLSPLCATVTLDCLSPRRGYLSKGGARVLGRPGECSLLPWSGCGWRSSLVAHHPPLWACGARAGLREQPRLGAVQTGALGACTVPSCGGPPWPQSLLERGRRCAVTAEEPAGARQHLLAPVPGLQVLAVFSSHVSGSGRCWTRPAGLHWPLLGSGVWPQVQGSVPIYERSGGHSG